MGIFDLFKNKKKKVKFTEEQVKWNRMWELWAENKVESPYAELMTYQSEINNGGHAQYFLNVRNMGSLNEELCVLKQVLTEKLAINLQKAYKAYLESIEKEDCEKTDAILEQCDNVFYENEEEINLVLLEYSAKIEF